MKKTGSIFTDKDQRSAPDPEMIMFSGNYPYCNYEPFVKSEIDSVWNKFHKIRVYAQVESAEIVHAEHPPNLICGRLCLRLGAWDWGKAWLLLFRSFFIKEIRFFLSRQRKKKFKGLKDIFYVAALAHKTCKHIDRIIELRKAGDPYSNRGIILYCYWTDHFTLAALLLKKRYPWIKVISRAHRWDIYGNLNPSGYLPFRKFFSENLDAFVFVSDDGLKYVSETLSISPPPNMFVSRLGVRRAVNECPSCMPGHFKLISCSYLVEVKRIHLIIEALACIQDMDVEWHHVGGGVLESDLRDLANSLLHSNSNISYNFYGQIDNRLVLNQMIEEKYSFLINTSSSEGIPFSMMEAMSLGIPVIATGVGGVAEIVEEGVNGFLMEENVRPDEIARMIVRAATLHEKEYMSLRAGAFNTWQERFNAEKNYNEFLAQLRELNVL